MSAAELPISLERDLFLRQLLRALSGTLEDVVGLDEAEGYISIVGGKIGDAINSDYRNAFRVEKLDRHQVSDVLVDLKRRIEGDFYVIEESDEKIVFGNNRCPFGEYVKGRPSLCMMTSNVFGTIASDNLGYARIELDETIARGDPGCKVTVYLTPSDDLTGNARDYYAAG